MVYIVARMIMPTCKAEELGKLLAVEGPKFDWKRFGEEQDKMFENVVPNAAKTTLQGGEVFTVSKVKPGMLEKALMATNAWYAIFTRVEGVEVSVDVYYSLDEAGVMLAPSPAKPAKPAKPSK
jgi:hypothetical protein